MFDTTQKLEISPREIELIESALETQSKILGVQAGAGGAGATEKLNEVKRVLATVSSQRVSDRRRSTGRSWTGLMRFMGQTT